MSDETVKQSTDSQEESGNAPSEMLLAQERKRSEELLVKLKYLQADFENYRKRADKERRDVAEASVRSLVL